MAVSIQASAAGLKIIDQARRKKNWTKKAAAWCDAAGGISSSTLDRFWAGQPIQQENFVAICKAVGIDNWEEIAENNLTESSSSRSFSFSAYNKETWVGRENILTTLSNQLRENTRLLLISGFTGIGKTALAECLAVRFQNPRMSFHRVSFDIEGQSQDFTTGAAAILAELGEPELDPQERNNPQRLSDRLLQKLQTKPYWIQLDALERLLPKESAEFVDAHWLNFFQRCLNSTDFPSRLVLTTQTSPTGFEEFVDRYPTQWHEETLQGLSALERSELFTRNGIAIDETNRETIDRIGQIYEGHPLVLQVIAREILAQPFNGNVTQYWQRYGNEFEQVARELQSQRVNPALYSRELQKRVRQRVEKSLKRLPTDALDLLCRASVYRRPVPETFWLALINDRSPTQQQEAYRTLGDRALVEQEGIHQGQFLIRQHNLIRDIAYDLLRQDSATWKTAERQAAYQWLTAYQPAPDVANLEQVRGYLEAFDHLLEVRDWKQAQAIAWTQLDTPTNEYLCWQLGMWGYCREQIQLYKKLVELCREIGDRQGEGITLGNLGIAYKNLSNYQQAIDCYQQALTINRKIGDRPGEAVNLTNLGNVYHIVGKNQDAIEYQQQCLTIVREIGDRRTESGALGSLGLAYNWLQQHEYALQYHKQHLAIAREIGDRRGEATALGSLGNTYYFLGNAQQAIEYHQKRLIICREIGDRRGEGNALSSLGMCCSRLSKYQEAIEYHRQHLEIAREVSEQQGEGNALGNLGATLAALERYPEAIEKLQLAAKIFNAIGSWVSEAQICQHLAELHQKTGPIDLAKQYCDRALALAIELGIPLVKECEELMEEINQQHE